MRPLLQATLSNAPCSKADAKATCRGNPAFGGPRSSPLIRAAINRNSEMVSHEAASQYESTNPTTQPYLCEKIRYGSQVTLKTATSRDDTSFSGVTVFGRKMTATRLLLGSHAMRSTFPPTNLSDSSTRMRLGYRRGSGKQDATSNLRRGALVERRELLL